MYSKITENIKVTAHPTYVGEDHAGKTTTHVWAYQIVIENLGNRTVQLMSRYWRIIDGFGHLEEVKGDGVVGDQPILKPGMTYTYSSGSHLNTESGIMEGKYFFKYEEAENPSAEELFEVDIPAFPLDTPHSNIIIN